MTTLTTYRPTGQAVTKRTVLRVVRAAPVDVTVQEVVDALTGSVRPATQWQRYQHQRQVMKVCRILDGLVADGKVKAVRRRGVGAAFKAANDSVWAQIRRAVSK